MQLSKEGVCGLEESACAWHSNEQQRKAGENGCKEEAGTETQVVLGAVYLSTPQPGGIRGPLGTSHPQQCFHSMKSAILLFTPQYPW